MAAHAQLDGHVPAVVHCVAGVPAGSLRWADQIQRDMGGIRVGEITLGNKYVPWCSLHPASDTITK